MGLFCFEKCFKIKIVCFFLLSSRQKSNASMLKKLHDGHHLALCVIGALEIWPLTVSNQRFKLLKADCF